MMEGNKHPYSAGSSNNYNDTVLEKIEFNPIINMEFNKSAIFIRNLKSWEHVELVSNTDANNFGEVFVLFQTKSYGMNGRHLDGGLIQVNASEAFRIPGERRTVQSGGLLWNFEKVVVQNDEGKKQLMFQTASIGDATPHDFKELYLFGAQEVEKL
ncbi:hypothetical protein B9Z55_026179 [Caenorhabditis nigoni]|uniref:Uncharacterized protein n=2 Tax=Caenorhabditis nigoni TaxID=1611254 RepID=A0A2G5T1L0_9PELO|nr:hypothetical protein B9Z55_026179 [Caenorhabditis nigoni]